MNNYFFTYLLKKYGEKNFNNLIEAILENGKLEGQVNAFNTNDWNFLYVFSVYLSVTLNFFGLKPNQIDLCLDTVVAPGLSAMFNSKKILKNQKELLPEIEKIVEEELNTSYK